MRRSVLINALVAVILTASIASAQTAQQKFPPAPPALMQAELTDLEGKKFTLNDFHGKVILVNLWGIWLGPSRAQMPDLSKLQEKYVSAGLEVIGINVGDHDLRPESIQKIKSFGDQYNIKYRLTQSSLVAVTETYKISKFEAVPQTFLLGRDGHLRGVWVGGGPNIYNQIRLLIKSIFPETGPTTIDNLPKDYLMERAVPIILRSEIKPSEEPRTVYLAETNIDAAWLPDIKGINFVLLNKEEQKERGGYEFLRPHHFRIEFVNWVAFGCQGKGSVWSVEQPQQSDVRVLRSPIELIHSCGSMDPHKK